MKKKNLAIVGFKDSFLVGFIKCFLMSFVKFEGNTGRLSQHMHDNLLCKVTKQDLPKAKFPLTHVNSCY